MSLASAHAKALGEKKLMVINGMVSADPKSKIIQDFVSEYALERCLVEETESEIRVTLYEDEGE